MRYCGELKWMISRTFLRSTSNLHTNSASCNNISALSVTWEAIQSFNYVRPNKIKLQCQGTCVIDLCIPPTRMQVLQLMSRARVICYDGQELISSLISHFDLEDEQGIISSFPWTSSG